MTEANPLLADWTAPFEMPPFAAIRPEHFPSAFEAGMAAQRAEIDAIAGDVAEPTFANTVAALERSGRRLRRVSAAFFNLTAAHTNDALDAIERDIAPKLSRHGSDIFQNDALFARIRALTERRKGLGLSAEETRVLDRYHRIFVRAGGGLDPAAKARLAEIGQRLAALGTQFGQNVLADEKSYTLLLDGEADLAGLPEGQRAAAAQAADERGHPGKHVVTLSRSSIEPFLQASTRRDLREAAFRAWTARGETSAATDNRPIIAETLTLRAERASLLGFADFAEFRLDNTMAGSPAAAQELLDTVWPPARAQALREAEALEAIVRDEGGNFDLAPWDWRHFAEKRRRAAFDFDAAEVKSYLTLEGMMAAAFHTAGCLFGVTFDERFDVPVYHPDVRAFAVSDIDGRPIGLFLGDYFARPSKRSGAWMSGFRGQQKLEGDIKPVIVNVMSFARGPEGRPTLLSFDDARTLFHEFGHALHGLLSDVTYPMISGTSVARDFVEFPSQLFEHWLEEPAVLGRFARHAETGDPMPPALLAKVLAARNFNQGFATVEYVASALFDLGVHRRTDVAGFDVDAVEAETLTAIGMPEAMVMRHRPPHFQHVFSGDGYAASYYSYLWSEVLDADGYGAFREAGDPFDSETARRLKDYVYSAGDLRDPAEAYRLFRGRMPDPAALLRQRGLDQAPVAGAA